MSKSKVITLTALIILAFGMTAIDNAVASEKNKAMVRRLLEEAYSKGNIAVGDELLNANVVFHNPDIEGIKRWKQFATMYRTAFPDLRIAVEDTIAEGDKVVARWRAWGTHKGDLRGIAPTGKQATWTGVATYRFAGGKIVEAWGCRDAIGLMRQLGFKLVPVSEKGGE